MRKIFVLLLATAFSGHSADLSEQSIEIIKATHSQVPSLKDLVARSVVMNLNHPKIAQTLQSYIDQRIVLPSCLKTYFETAYRYKRVDSMKKILHAFDEKYHVDPAQLNVSPNLEWALAFDKKTLLIFHIDGDRCAEYHIIPKKDVGCLDFPPYFTSEKLILCAINRHVDNDNPDFFVFDLKNKEFDNPIHLPQKAHILWISSVPWISPKANSLVYVDSLLNMRLCNTDTKKVVSLPGDFIAADDNFLVVRDKSRFYCYDVHNSTLLLQGPEKSQNCTFRFPFIAVATKNLPESVNPENIDIWSIESRQLVRRITCNDTFIEKIGFLDSGTIEVCSTILSRHFLFDIATGNYMEVEMSEKPALYSGTIKNGICLRKDDMVVYLNSQLKTRFYSDKDTNVLRATNLATILGAAVLPSQLPSFLLKLFESGTKINASATEQENR